MPKIITRASIAGATLSGAQAKTALLGILDALNGAGLQEGGRTTLTADATLTVTQAGLLLVDCTSGDVDLTLPASGDATDDVFYIICRTDNTGNTLSVLKSGADTIEGAGTAQTVAGKGVMNIQMPADSTNWRIVYRSGSTAAGARTAIAAAAAGANADITSLSGLTTALSVAQGGTGGVNANEARANLLQFLSARQTVWDGPVDSNGLPNFGGSTGGTTVTASGTLIPTTANGVSGDRIGSITNPSWAGLSTNGTMYLYLDIAADGTCTTGSTTLQPTYQWGGTRSITSGQATFNTQEMSMTVGNGSSAVQTHRVFVGQVTVAGGVVTAITWYGLMGRYTAPWVATLPAGGSGASFNHNLGVADTNALLELECTTADAAYSVGDRITNINGNSGGVAIPITIATASMTSQFIFPATANALAQNKTTGANTNLTLASWKYRMRVQRSW